MLWVMLSEGRTWSAKRIAAEAPCWKGEISLETPLFKLTIGWQRNGADVVAATNPAADASSPDEGFLTPPLGPDEIDQQFAKIADDKSYQEEAIRIAEER